jgi:hypothetical protein
MHDSQQQIETLMKSMAYIAEQEVMYAACAERRQVHV